MRPVETLGDRMKKIVELGSGYEKAMPSWFGFEAPGFLKYRQEHKPEKHQGTAMFCVVQCFFFFVAHAQDVLTTIYIFISFIGTNNSC